MKDEKLNYLSKSNVCCFTGYRPLKCPWGYNENDKRCIKMKENTKNIIENSILNGYEIFLCGMAIGFDMICADIVLELKHKYPKIKLIGILPCKNQDKKWNKSYKEKYKLITNKLDDLYYIYDNYNDKCMIERNKFMVDNSSLCIALFDGKSGGTKYTVQYAKSKKIKILYVEF